MSEPTIRKVQQLFLPRDTPTSGEHERGAERNRRALVTGGAATIARVVQMGTSLVTVPFTLRYLGNERFGLWMTISSVLAMAAFADFGVGNGVLNTVARAFGKDDVEGVRRAVSSGFAVLSSIAVLLLFSFFAVYRFVNWADFFRVVSTQARSEAGPALAVFATCFALNISMDVVQRVQLGLQQGYRYGLWQLAGSMAGLVGVLGGIRFHVSLPVLVVAIAGAPIFATTLNTVHFFGFVHPELRPRWKLVSREVISQIGRLGGLFFFLQVVVAVSFSADNFIIARTLGAVNVPEYSIPQRMFSVISMFVAMMVSPLWPAYGEALSRGHIGWVRRTLFRSLLLVFGGGCLASGTMLLLSRRLIFWWVGTHVSPPMFLLAGMAIWTVLECCGTTLAMFLNGASVMRFQIVTGSLFGIACLTTKIVMVRRFGIAAVPWSTAGTYLLFSAIPCVVFVHRFFRRTRSASGVPVMLPDC
jgi:O-antigen/teichoic acid export membrane protein